MTCEYSSGHSFSEMQLPLFMVLHSSKWNFLGANICCDLSIDLYVDTLYINWINIHV